MTYFSPAFVLVKCHLFSRWHALYDVQVGHRLLHCLVVVFELHDIVLAGLSLLSVFAACDCDTTGTVGGSATCNDQGQCQCLLNFGGKKCSECGPGFHNYPTCKTCDCSAMGSFGKSCGQSSAQCDCRPNFRGLKCSS